ncbi:MAG TPA: alanine--glyoxylate aminotransferase family protein [Terriglobales bacterium]|jgi:alanine-glyoxylate transaminase/serine-glyoxylate transaminase/serine-pyruvate transaminase|nr:alanine--glyoxylate aminotransferase family protein [Terriglobales bacterium]
MSAAPKANPPIRTLLGPGPSPVSSRVLQAMSLPVVGHLDPKFLEIMDQNMAMLREVFQTKNRLALPMSGTGSAGMETCFVNLIEPGDAVLIGVNGVFGTRMVDVAQRCGAQVDTVEAEWGTALDAEKFKDALAKKKYKIVALVHAETSTGVLQPLDDIAKLVHDSGALLLVDAVTSLGGAPVRVDELGIDACYSGTQKCLGCPPGLSPVTLNERAVEILRKRKTKVQSWYLDLSMIEKYWGSERVYHHTAPISMNYALHEALRIVLEEGLHASWGRHRQVHETFVREMRKLELEPAVAERIRAPMINAVKIPDGVDDAKVRQRLYDDFNIEIGAGLGPLKGKIWRVGLMGHGARGENVDLLAKALKQLI